MKWWQSHGFTGTITKNQSGSVEASITSAGFSGTGATSQHNGFDECTAAGGFGNAYITVANLPLTLRSTPSTPEHGFEFLGSGASKVRFIIGSTVAGVCEYETTSAAVTGTYTTAAATVLAVNSTQAGSGSKLIKGGFLCPSSGQFVLNLSLETENTSTLGIS